MIYLNDESTWSNIPSDNLRHKIPAIILLVPVVRPGIIAALIFCFLVSWNEFLFAIIFIDSNKYRTIPAGLMSFRDALQIDWGPLLAGMAISAVPIMIFFISVQKHFVRGMMAGSVKG